MRKLLILTYPFLLSMGFSQSYAGSDSCATCHAEKYSDWSSSGHHYKFNVIEDNQPPTYPDFVTNFQDTWMDSLGDGSLDWSNIAGVIGGYGWKARFVGTDGHLIGTAGSTLPGAGNGHNQFNFYGGEAHGWVDYHPGDEKIYNYGCFKCHTTGGDTSGTWLPGVEDLGTFTEGGIGCEGCHGPGSDHVSSASVDDINRVYTYAHLDNDLGGLELDGTIITPDSTGDGGDVNFLCGTCHNRSYTDPINASGGYIRHHEQWDEIVTTSHYANGFDCNTCHEPHKRVNWQGDGIDITCQTCHGDEAATINHEGNTGCIDCHMPFAAKSGTTRGESGFKADVRSHLFAITPDTASMFTADGSAVRDDEDRAASLSPGFSCLGCHNDDSGDSIPEKTLADAAAEAVGMHTPVSVEPVADLPVRYALKQNYPNPFNPGTTIEYELPHGSMVNITIVNLQGRVVQKIATGFKNAGQHRYYWNGRSADNKDLPSGVYFVKMQASDYSAVIKMTMLK